MTDIEIARNIKMKNITEIAEGLNLNPSAISLYGNYKAKIEPITTKGDASVVLVTAISPTPAGEGKSTITIGLADGLNSLNKKTITCLREPSLGPVFGIKGGACGGGMSQVVPMEDINLHFTGDFHAITSANNLICAVIDNVIYQGNKLNIDINNILIKRVIDMNDRSLREITIGQGNKFNGIERSEGFDITVASEIMAILCLANDEKEFEKMINAMLIAKNIDGENISVKELNITGSIMALMKDALKPNLVQTLEHNPVLIHGGPFANIAHGCNSIIATNTAKNLGEIVVTEAGFGSDLGFEKFLNIKSRKANLNIDVVVLVATLKSIKMHGGIDLDNIYLQNIKAIEKGFINMLRHVENIKRSNINYVVCLNKHKSDTDMEIECFLKLCKESNINVEIATGFNEGSKGMLKLSSNVIELLKTPGFKRYNYELTDSLEVKLNRVIKDVYGGKGFILKEGIVAKFNELKNVNLPICIAKTPMSFSGDSKKLGAPIDFNIIIQDLKLNSGAEFIIVYASKVMTMPGLGTNANVYDITYEDGEINNLS